MRSAEEFEHVQRLVAAGLNDCAIARQTGIPRPTIRGWRHNPPASLPRPASSSPCGVDHDFSGLTAAPYCYLLGLYLGDGCISLYRRVWRLRIVLDQKYPTIGVDQLIAFLSETVTLEPGDVIATGTPAGVGFARTPPVYLKPGDIMEVEVEGLGILSNPVLAERLDRY